MKNYQLFIQILHSIKPVRSSHGFTLSAKDEKGLKDALSAWPFGAQEFDRVVVELFHIPPTVLSRARGVCPRSLGCYDTRVVLRYPHVKECDVTRRKDCI
jgi:hypothetical protein